MFISRQNVVVLLKTQCDEEEPDDGGDDLG